MSDKFGVVADLPESWVLTTLGEVCMSSQYGWTTSASKQGDLHLLRTTDITQGNIDWSSVPFCKNNPPDVEKYLSHDGDILISRAGSVGYSYLVKNPKKAVFASYLIRFRPLIEGRYLSFFLKSPNYWKSISEKSIGIALANVNASKLRQITVPLAPLPEQSRIADKLEELFSFLDAGVESLRKVRAQLKRYRQAVLKYAFDGKLTEEWRKTHKDSIEPAIDLLRRVERERRDGKQKGLVESEEQLSFNSLPELPETWVWTTMRRLILDARYGISQKCFPKPDGVPVLRIPNIVKERVDLHDLKYTRLTDEEFKRFSAKLGDILVIRTNGSLDLVGRAATINEPEHDFAFASYLIRLRPVLMGTLPKYLTAVISSHIGRKVIEERARTTAGQFNVNLATLRAIPIPLPPLTEQTEIIEMIERAFSIIEDTEGIMYQSTKMSEHLRQSILDRAFKGKLVPQDPIDEPAEKLLERIKAERFNNEKPKIDNQVELSRYVQ